MCVYRAPLVETSHGIIFKLHLYFLMAVWEINFVPNVLLNT